MQRYSASLAISEIQIKIKLGLSPSRQTSSH